VIKRVIIVLCTAFSIACVGAATNPGPTGPNTPWPCGYQGHSCGANHMCCWNDEDCGDGQNGCFANYCCFNPSDANDALLRMSRKPHAQIAESKMPARR
jgi:hypothetical protein